MSPYRSAVLALFGLLVTTSIHATDDPTIGDASLNDIFFVDAGCGWAVGDQGVIWHTEDGGQSWQLQQSGTVCPLRSVWFIDRNTGWTVGGQGVPYSSVSRGLVLATIDGGRTWQPFSWNQFPRLLRVQFLNAKTGWAWGEASDYYPSGLFSSDSSGRMWAPSAGAVGASWFAGFFMGPETGVLAGAGGTTALLLNRNVTPVTAGSLGGRTIRSLKFSSDGTGWAVADGGIVLRSASRGASWSVLTSGMPDETAAIFDWRGVHAIGRSVWIVGHPGSVALCSDDAGSRWRTVSTGQPVPLEAVWFHDRQQGWAVGALGTILSTQDGGNSWRVQRRGGERAAVLSVHGSPKRTPLLAHVQLGAELGYLVTDLTMVSPARDPENPLQSNAALRVSDAVRAAGAAASQLEWRFPAVSTASSLAQVLAEWDRHNEGHALRDIERRLVIAVRSWRPDVVLSESPDPGDGDDPSAALVAQVLERAFESAADATAFPELIESAELAPWRATKLLAATRNPAAAQSRCVGADLSHREEWVGRPLDDQANLAMALLADSFCSSDQDLYYRSIMSRIPRGNDDPSVMAGIVLEPGGPARRRLALPAEISDAQRRAAQARRNLLALVNRADNQPILAQQMNAQLAQLVTDLPADQAGTILYRLARLHFDKGRWSQTRELLEKLLNDNPNHLTAAESQRWLVQYYASSEARHRERTAGIVGQSVLKPQVQRRPAPASEQGENPGGKNELTPANDVRVAFDQQASAVGGMGSGTPWSRGALDAAKQLMQSAPLVWSEPQLQFTIAAAHRQLGNIKDADKFYATLALGRDAGVWSDAARSERWIRDRKGLPSKPVLVSQRGATPPRLDGVLDDPIWKSASPVSLNSTDRSADDKAATQLRIAHDQQFVYVAVSCETADGRAVPPLRPRTRDMDLTEQDRVEFYIDLDRDYGTYYHFAVDRRGCVFEDCWGDRTWDPIWYVASQSDEHGYRIEAAIPIGELTDMPPVDGVVWAFNAVRIIPGRPVLSWSRPAGANPHPEGLGLLLFSDGPATLPARPALAN